MIKPLPIGSERFSKAEGRWWRKVRMKGKKKWKRRAVCVMEEMIGCPIPEGYEVHHRNEDQTDDRPSNLQLMKKRKHRSLHMKKWRSRQTHKLDERKARYIRRKYKKGDDKYDLAYFSRKFGIGRSYVSKVVRGKRLGAHDVR